MTEPAAEATNIIDFTVIKMLQLYERYSVSGQAEHAAAIWEALEAYSSGSCTIIFKGGIPYITAPQPVDIDEET